MRLHIARALGCAGLRTPSEAQFPRRLFSTASPLTRHDRRHMIARARPCHTKEHMSSLYSTCYHLVVVVARSFQDRPPFLVRRTSSSRLFSIVQYRLRGSDGATTLIARGRGHTHTTRTIAFPWDRGPSFVLKPSSQTYQRVDNTPTLQHRWPPEYWYQCPIGKVTLKRCGIA